MEKRYEEVQKRKQRLAEAVKMQEIEGNPLTPNEIVMFQMFEHKSWSLEKCRQYILDLHNDPGPKTNWAE